MRKLKLYLPLVLLFIITFLSSPEGVGAAWPPESAYVNGVIGHPQQWRLSCESRAAADFAAFFGYNISEAEILNKVSLPPRTDNPNYGFVGDVNGTWGQIPPNPYGVHSNPIEGALRKYGLPAYGERNLSWEFLRSQIANGRPVIVWIIGAMWDGTSVPYTDSLGRKAIVAPYEHTVILVGYNATTVRVVDAYDGLTKTYSLSSFLRSWKVLENQGVFYQVNYTDRLFIPIVASKGSSAATSTQEKPAVENPIVTGTSYIVKPGDWLGKIAHQTGVPWEQLAEINNLTYPFTLFPGQVIRLK